MEALSLATIGAARAIGMDDEVGALGPGRWGDVAAVRMAPAGTGESALEAALAGSPADVAETILGGRTVYRG